MEKVRISKALSEKCIDLRPNGLVATKNSVQEAIDYVDTMNSFEAHLAFYILWNAISKDYILIPRDSVTEEDK